MVRKAIRHNSWPCVYRRADHPRSQAKSRDRPESRRIDFRLRESVTSAIWRRLHGMVGLSVFLKFRDQASGFITNCGVHAFEPLSSREAHRGSTVRHCRFIKEHNDVDFTGEANTSPWFLSRGSFRLLRYLLFRLLFLFVYLLFPTLVLILLAFVSHCVPPFPVVPHLLAARAPLRRQFCPCVLSWRM